MSAPTCTASAPVVVGKVCAWCRPGVNATEGHGICAPHKASLLAELTEISAPTPSPKEIQTQP